MKKWKVMSLVGTILGIMLEEMNLQKTRENAKRKVCRAGKVAIGIVIANSKWSRCLSLNLANLL